MQGLNCRVLRAHLIGLARGESLEEAGRRALTSHLKACSDCAREFEKQVRLTAALRDVAKVAVPALDTVEARLLAEFDTVRRSRRRRVARWLPAVAATLLLGAFLTARLLLPVRQPTPTHRAAAPVQTVPPPQLEAAVRAPVAPHRARLHRPTAPAAAPERAALQPFVAIPYTVPLAPDERTEVIRMDLPLAALIAVGLPLEAADPGARAEADVLVGEDGRARAIRLLSVSTFTLDR